MAKIKTDKMPKKVTCKVDVAEWIDSLGASISYLVYGHVARRSAEVWHDTLATPGWDTDPELDAERAALRFVDLEAML